MLRGSYSYSKMKNKNELKTLKDLKYIPEVPNCDSRSKEIKQEAIKWVKLALKLENMCIDIKDWKSASYHAGFQKAIKLFHDITEEDLK